MRHKQRREGATGGEIIVFLAFFQNKKYRFKYLKITKNDKMGCHKKRNNNSSVSYAAKDILKRAYHPKNTCNEQRKANYR